MTSKIAMQNKMSLRRQLMQCLCIDIGNQLGDIDQVLLVREAVNNQVYSLNTH